MKFRKSFPLITLSLLALGAHAASASEAGSLTIEMQGIQADAGQAIFILMDSESSHQGKTPIFTRKLSAINLQSASVTFSNLPTGDYSAVIYHDVNANGELERNFFGKPMEPYGFSNNARYAFGIPDFDDSRFEVRASQNVQTITVK